MTGVVAALAPHLSSGARVVAGEGERALYSRDCWPYLGLLARAGQPSLRPPDAVVFPANEEDVIATVRWCADAGVPLVPVGGGSGVTGAAVPVHGGVAIDMKRLDALDLSMAESGLVCAGGGWVGARLEHELNRNGLTLGHFPSSILCSTLGGYVATRSAGQLSSRHGKIEDMVVSVRFVDPAGVVRRTWTGAWDTTQLLVGSEGTLGVVLDAWVRVEPQPVARRYRGFACSSVEAGLEAIREIVQSGARPAVVRLYDEFDTYISGARKAAEPAREPGRMAAAIGRWAQDRVDAAAAKKHALRAANALLGRTMGATIALNRLAGRVHDESLLILGVEERTEALADAQAEDVFAIARRTLRDLGTAPGEHWYENRYAVSYKMSPLIGAGLFVDTMEVATRWTNLVSLYDAVKRALEPHVFVMAHFSHAYATGCSIYFTFAGFGVDDEACIERYRATWETAMAAVAGAGGAVTHHHGIGLMKARGLEDDHAGGKPLFDAFKSAVDPSSLLNPGKLWHTTEPFL